MNLPVVVLRIEDSGDGSNLFADLRRLHPAKTALEQRHDPSYAAAANVLLFSGTRAECEAARAKVRNAELGDNETLALP